MSSTGMGNGASPEGGEALGGLLSRLVVICCGFLAGLLNTACLGFTVADDALGAINRDLASLHLLGQVRSLLLNALRL